MTIKQQNGRCYYYRPVRRGDQVIKRYIAPLNETLPNIIRKHENLRRAIGEEVSKQRKNAHEQIEGIARLIQLCRVRLNIAIAGYPDFPFDALPELQNMERHLLQDLAQRAAGGSKSAIDHLQDWFHTHPRSIDAVGCINSFVVDSVVNVLSDNDSAAKEMLAAAIERQREHLLSLCESPLARVAADNVITCWLTVTLALARSAAGVYLKTPEKGDKTITTAQRQLLDAIHLFERMVEKTEQFSGEPTERTEVLHELS